MLCFVSPQVAPAAFDAMDSYLVLLLRIPVLCYLASFVIGGDTDPGSLSSADGVYNSSFTPSNLPWNTYNYCNAPHVNAKHYSLPANASHPKLVYMNAVIRHHKRSPDNLYPEENELNSVPWDCSDFSQFSYGGSGSHVFHETTSPSWHPFLSQIWTGSCDTGQLTKGGFDDATAHGKDFWSVYGRKLGFLTSVNEKDIFIRTSTETRTFQVASGFLTGMDPATTARSFPVTTQPSPIDSIVPSYSCPAADAIRDAYQSVPAWTDHLDANADLKARLDATLGTANRSDWASWYDHFFDTFTSRTCHGHPLPCNSTGACVSEADAAKVVAIGDWEYNYIWNAADNATAYNQLTFGVFIQELAQNFKLFRSGGDPYKLRFYVGHDGSMIRLAALLGLGKVSPLRWPAMGSEIVMEVWQTKQDEKFVRVIHEGTPVSGLEWIPLDTFISSLESQVPAHIFELCNGS
ncbi:phosphoglycerate mutase-like protein [Lentinus tigrinus ALCF2SS1-6]|uniref:Phosphoglycerate mutase-like protein n=1 Tax=Lentinus tigrinus ALCF2SS1-6 TaxID=1328759 RepID=A0A5C2SJL6_9APHY|nr:phosphoglycerate mutase-like protein [Lentinus tigrinus ALCF2SS1-6]